MDTDRPVSRRDHFGFTDAELPGDPSDTGLLPPSRICGRPLDPSVSGEWDPETVFDLFGKPSARRILALASVDPVTATDVAAHLDVAKPTVYRHLEELVEYDLLTERQHLDDDGNRYQTYTTNLESVTFGVDDGAFTVDIALKQDVVSPVERDPREE